jgi:hypothetical protein
MTDVILSNSPSIKIIRRTREFTPPVCHGGAFRHLLAAQADIVVDTLLAKLPK